MCVLYAIRVTHFEQPSKVIADVPWVLMQCEAKLY
jgi:hypothetical protein